MTTSIALDRAANRVAEALQNGEYTEALTRQIVEGMTRRDLIELAMAGLFARALTVERAWTKRAEVRATKSRVALHGRSKLARSGCDCAECVAWRERQVEVDEWELDREAKMINRLGAILEEYKAELRTEWTTELLDATFALPDGIRVMWGEATIEQHEARIQMLSSIASGTLETAARHGQAVDELRAASAATLNDLVRVAA